MTYIKEYWDNKEMRAKQAQKNNGVGVTNYHC